MVVRGVAYDGILPLQLAHLLAAPELHALDTVTSTLDAVHDLAAAGALDGAVVLADEQTHGRGRQGRTWHSPKGAGLWLGYLFRPNAPVEARVLSLRVGIVLARTLGTLGQSVGLKWPNDVMLADRKLAGILCEARWGEAGGWVAIGIGMNVRGPVPAGVSGAVALAEHRPEVTRIAVLEALVPQLHHLPRAPTLEASEREEFARYDWLRGRAIARPVSGTAHGVDAEGALLVATRHGIERTVAGSVTLA